MVAAKRDLKKSGASFFTAGPDWELATLPPAQYLVIEGSGSPEPKEYAEALGLCFTPWRIA